MKYYVDDNGDGWVHDPGRTWEWTKIYWIERRIKKQLFSGLWVQRVNDVPSPGLKEVDVDSDLEFEDYIKTLAKLR